MISGVLYALLAGLMWGLIFVGPLIVPEYPAVLQSMGRYLALGLIALPIAWLGRARLRQLVRKDWVTALTLTMMGNLIYYVCLASAIQRTGAWWQLTPSVFVHSRHSDNAPAAPPAAFFACPVCRTPLGEPAAERLTCANPACGRAWRVENGLYDFKEPV